MVCSRVFSLISVRKLIRDYGAVIRRCHRIGGALNYVRRKIETLRTVRNKQNTKQVHAPYCRLFLLNRALFFFFFLFSQVGNLFRESDLLVANFLTCFATI